MTVRDRIRKRAKQFAHGHPWLAAAAIVLVIVAGIAAFVLIIETFGWPGSSESATGLSTSTLDAACADAFSEGWSHSGVLGTHEPTIYCAGPNGEQGMMEMPRELIKQSDFVTPETYHG